MYKIICKQINLIKVETYRLPLSIFCREETTAGTLHIRRLLQFANEHLDNSVEADRYLYI